MKSEQIRRWTLLSAVSARVLQASAVADMPTDMELLGKFLFYQGISTPGSMACAVCHGPSVGFAGPDAEINKHGAVYRGAVPDRFSNLKLMPQAAAIAAFLKTLSDGYTS